LGRKTMGNRKKGKSFIQLTAFYEKKKMIKPGNKAKARAVETAPTTDPVNKSRGDTQRKKKKRKGGLEHNGELWEKKKAPETSGRALLMGGEGSEQRGRRELKKNQNQNKKKKRGARGEMCQGLPTNTWQ